VKPRDSVNGWREATVWIGLPYKLAASIKA
jgi:hypothetical protein